MKFKLDTPAKPKIGDATEWARYFCWRPTRVDNYIVWLELVRSRKIFLVKQRASGEVPVGAWEREFKFLESEIQ